MRFEKRWNVRWNGHDIEVRNWWNLLLISGEQLLIDGKVADETKGWLSISRDLSATVASSGVEHAVRAHIGSVDGGLRVGCLIYADDKVIGGDTDKSFIQNIELFGGDIGDRLAMKADTPRTSLGANLTKTKIRLMLLAAAIPSLIPYAIYRLEYLTDIAALKYAFVLAVVGYHLCANRYQWWSEAAMKSSIFARLVISFLLGTLITLLLFGYLILINANIGHQQAITISGIVVDKFTAGRRADSYHVVVKEFDSGNVKKLELSSEEFARTRIGHEFRQTWHKGSLGFLYQSAV